MPPSTALTATFILHKSRKDRLESVRELNAWGQDIEDLSILSETPLIEVLALACNNIRSLKQLSRCKKLRQLLLRKNQVSDIAEVYHLSKLPDLQILSLSDNPVTADEDYRAKVLAYLPQLQKLDDALVTPDEVEEAQARYPDAPHGVSTDGGGGGSEGGDWDGQRSRTPPGPSPARSPAQTPPGGQSQTPPCSRTPSVSGGGHPADGAAAAGGQQPHYSVPSPQPPQQLPPQQQYPGYDGSQQRSPPSASQQLQFGGTNGAVSGYGGGGPAANGTPPLHPQQQQPQQQPMQQPQQLQLPPQQQYYSPLQQQQSPPPNYSPNGMPHFQGVPQYMTSGWAGGPVQQAPQPQPQQQAPPLTAPSETTSDNIFYAIVALLPELSPKHLLWVKGEVEARLLEVQQQQLNING